MTENPKGRNHGGGRTAYCLSEPDELEATPSICHVVREEVRIALKMPKWVGRDCPGLHIN